MEIICTTVLSKESAQTLFTDCEHNLYLVELLDLLYVIPTYPVIDIKQVLEHYDTLLKRKRNMQSNIYLNKCEFLYFNK